MTPRRPTIVSVAERAGVSKSLVSLVTRGAPNVSDMSRRAVLQAAEDLGYRPNLVARNQAERRTRTLGLLVSDLHNPFFAVIVDAIQSAAREHGLRILMGSGRRDAAEEAEVIESFLQQDVEGLVLLSPVVGRDDLALAAESVPTVVVGRTDIRVPRCDAIINDNQLGAELVVGHLLERGHTRIAYIDAPSGPGASERRAGYLAAMERHGLAPAIAGGDFTEEGGWRGGRELEVIAGEDGRGELGLRDHADDAPCSLEEALGAADVISLHAPLTTETRGLIDDVALRLVKPGAVLINCGRGGLLDLDAAYGALLDGRLSGVGLDVFDPEPPHDHPLFHHPDVALSPHVMALSRRARALVFEEMATGMDAVLCGRRAAAVANPRVYAPA